MIEVVFNYRHKIIKVHILSIHIFMYSSYDRN